MAKMRVWGAFGTANGHKFTQMGGGQAAKGG